MATKAHFLIAKHDFGFSETLIDRYSNLNLNQNNHSFPANNAQSKSAINKCEKYGSKL